MKPDITEGQNQVIKAQEELIRELSKEIRKLSLKTIRLKTHLQVLSGTPSCRTAEKIRQEVFPGCVFTDSITNLN